MSEDDQGQGQGDAMKGRMSKLEGRVEELAWALNGLGGRWEALDGRVGRALNDHFDRVDGLEDDVKNRLVALEDRVHELEGARAGAGRGTMQALEALEARMPNVEQGVANIKSVVDMAGVVFTEMDNRVGLSLEALVGRVEELERHGRWGEALGVLDGRWGEQLGALEGRVGRVDDRVTALEDDVNGRPCMGALLAAHNNRLKALEHRVAELGRDTMQALEALETCTRNVEKGVADIKNLVGDLTRHRVRAFHGCKKSGITQEVNSSRPLLDRCFDQIVNR